LSIEAFPSVRIFVLNWLSIVIAVYNGRQHTQTFNLGYFKVDNCIGIYFFP